MPCAIQTKTSLTYSAEASTVLCNFRKLLNFGFILQPQYYMYDKYSTQYALQYIRLIAVHYEKKNMHSLTIT